MHRIFYLFHPVIMFFFLSNENHLITIFIIRPLIDLGENETSGDQRERERETGTLPKAKRHRQRGTNQNQRKGEKGKSIFLYKAVLFSFRPK